MRALTIDEVGQVSGASRTLAAVGDFLTAASLPMMIFGPEASASALVGAGIFYGANALFGD